MYRVWFDDLEKAIAALRAKTDAQMFCSISGNWNGDFIFQIAEDRKYLVKHEDFSVWQNFGSWRVPVWREI